MVIFHIERTGRVLSKSRMQSNRHTPALRNELTCCYFSCFIHPPSHTFFIHRIAEGAMLASAPNEVRAHCKSTPRIHLYGGQRIFIDWYELEISDELSETLKPKLSSRISSTPKLVTWGKIFVTIISYGVLLLRPVTLLPFIHNDISIVVRFLSDVLSFNCYTIHSLPHREIKYE